MLFVRNLSSKLNNGFSRINFYVHEVWQIIMNTHMQAMYYSLSNNYQLTAQLKSNLLLAPARI